jgi:hypothetical protein
VAQPVRLRVAQALEPTANTLRFLRRDEARGADIQKERVIRVDSDPVSELLCSCARLPTKPVIIRVSTSHDDAVMRQLMKADGLTVLEFIPDQGEIRGLTHKSLVR